MAPTALISMLTVLDAADVNRRCFRADRVPDPPPPPSGVMVSPPLSLELSMFPVGLGKWRCRAAALSGSRAAAASSSKHILALGELPVGAGTSLRLAQFSLLSTSRP